MAKVNGNTEGIKNTLLERMAGIYDMRMAQQEFASHELVAELSELTGILGREISVYIGRDGRVADVSIGDSGKVSMPNMRLVRNEDRLCGVRCIHTHPSGDGRLSGVDIGTLKSMRLDSMAALGVNAEGEATAMYAAYIGDADEAGERNAYIYGPMRPYKLPQRLLVKEIYTADDRLKSSTYEAEGSRPERAILVGLENSEPYDTLDELGELAKTAGAVVVGKFTQRRSGIDNATYIGSGKAEELSLKESELEADIFIFDDELSAIQTRNLEEILGARVIDRTALILDIFALRATSREGKLQVELAQQKYRLPRLLGQGAVMSRLGGGIGTRGPGEKKLEIDKRRIRRRIYELSEELSEIEKQRGLRRARRQRNSVPLVALVGYTNAGKSTLLNALTGAGVMAEDMLFATLDPVVRQAMLPDGTPVLLSDTVGFINKLPHDLVEAFRSTLEEAAAADLILHVVDRSSSYYESQMAVVEEVLSSLGAGDVPRINVYNKRDLIDEHIPADGIFISAARGEGIDLLLSEMERQLNSTRAEIELIVPYDKYEAMTIIRSEGRILFEEHDGEGAHVRAQLEESTMWKLKKILGEGYGKN
ncbi:MAG: GTPase HflX [Clostridia bacterium]|nr:GTPase HflX [Clostridia bacterium]